MSARFAASAALACALMAPGFVPPAQAEDITTYKGEYLSGQLGFNDLKKSDHSGPGISTQAEFDANWIGAIALGHAFGNGLRLEGEIARRENDTDSVGGAAGSGSMKAHSFMLNGVYDIATGGLVVPYVGGGIGFAKIDSDVSPVGGSRVASSDTGFAWQAILGAAVPIANGLDLTADLRYFVAASPSITLASGTGIEAEYRNASVMVGLRWRFGAPAPAPQPAAAPMPAPQPAPQAAPAPAPQPAPVTGPRSFLIFFDWDKSDITADARKILEAAAAAAKAGSLVSIQLTGHADRSGPVRYNQRLSERRAAAAKAVLVKLGLASNAIATVGRGETQPLVPTDDGVREPRNRRVEIQF